MNSKKLKPITGPIRITNGTKWKQVMCFAWPNQEALS